MNDEERVDPFLGMPVGDGPRLPLKVKVPYSYELGSLIISKIFEGGKLSEICGRHGIPSIATVFAWMHHVPEFREAYDVTRESLALLASEDIQELARTSRYMDRNEVPAAKLRFDVLKFIAERNDRTRYAVQPPKDDIDSGVTIVIDTGTRKDPTDSRTVSDLVREMREDEYSEGHESSGSEEDKSMVTDLSTQVRDV